MKASAVIAIDPGPVRSALVKWDGERVGFSIYKPNDEILQFLYQRKFPLPVVIEKIASYGMPVGETTFETVYWSGRFAEASGIGTVDRITRGEVKMHLCHSMRAKDGNVRWAIIDRFGGKEKAIGRKATPGPLHGIAGDVWAALAVAITWWDTHSDDHAIEAPFESTIEVRQ